MRKNGRGPAPPCDKEGCLDTSVIKQGHQMLCPKHYRFGQMRAFAKRLGKYAPSNDELQGIFDSQGMACIDCGREMNWRMSEGKCTVLSLQHYRDGSLAFVCLSCNTRHASMPADTFCHMQSDHKLCPACGKVKHGSEFTKDNSRSGELRRKSRCRSCSDELANRWRESNREKYNAYQRAYRAKRKAEGNPVASGS